MTQTAKPILNFPPSRILGKFTDLSVMEQKLLVVAAGRAKAIANGESVKPAAPTLKVVPQEVQPHVLNLPRGKVFEIICFADSLVQSNNYTQLYDAGAALSSRQIHEENSRSKRTIPLIILPELFKGTGLYHFMIHEALLPDFVALADYYECLGGYAFVIHTEYRRRLYYYFSQRNAQGNFIRRDRDDKVFTSTDDMAALLGLDKPNYIKPDGHYDFGQIKVTLSGVIKWLAANTDLQILPTDKEGNLKYEYRMAQVGKRIEGIFTNARTIAGRTAESVAIHSITYYQLWEKLGFKKAEVAAIVQNLSRLQQDEILAFIHANFEPATHTKEGFARSAFASKYPKLLAKHKAYVNQVTSPLMS